MRTLYAMAEQTKTTENTYTLYKDTETGELTTDYGRTAGASAEGVDPFPGLRVSGIKTTLTPEAQGIQRGIDVYQRLTPSQRAEIDAQVKGSLQYRRAEQGSDQDTQGTLLGRAAIEYARTRGIDTSANAPSAQVVVGRSTVFRTESRFTPEQEIRPAPVQSGYGRRTYVGFEGVTPFSNLGGYSPIASAVPSSGMLASPVNPDAYLYAGGPQPKPKERVEVKSDTTGLLPLKSSLYPTGTAMERAFVNQERAAGPLEIQFAAQSKALKSLPVVGGLFSKFDEAFNPALRARLAVKLRGGVVEDVVASAVDVGRAQRAQQEVVLGSLEMGLTPSMREVSGAVNPLVAGGQYRLSETINVGSLFLLPLGGRALGSVAEIAASKLPAKVSVGFAPVVRSLGAGLEMAGPVARPLTVGAVSAALSPSEKRYQAFVTGVGIGVGGEALGFALGRAAQRPELFKTQSKATSVLMGETGELKGAVARGTGSFQSVTRGPLKIVVSAEADLPVLVERLGETRKFFGTTGGIARVYQRGANFDPAAGLTGVRAFSRVTETPRGGFSGVTRTFVENRAGVLERSSVSLSAAGLKRVPLEFEGELQSFQPVFSKRGVVRGLRSSSYAVKPFEANGELVPFDRASPSIFQRVKEFGKPLFKRETVPLKTGSTVTLEVADTMGVERVITPKTTVDRVSFLKPFVRRSTENPNVLEIGFGLTGKNKIRAFEATSEGRVVQQLARPTDLKETSLFSFSTGKADTPTSAPAPRAPTPTGLGPVDPFTIGAGNIKFEQVRAVKPPRPFEFPKGAIPNPLVALTEQVAKKEAARTAGGLGRAITGSAIMSPLIEQPQQSKEKLVTDEKKSGGFDFGRSSRQGTSASVTSESGRGFSLGERNASGNDKRSRERTGEKTGTGFDAFSRNAFRPVIDAGRKQAFDTSLRFTQALAIPQRSTTRNTSVASIQMPFPMPRFEPIVATPPSILFTSRRPTFVIPEPKAKPPTKTGYTASLLAVELGITSTKKPGILTGLDIRPLLTRGKKKK